VIEERDNSMVDEMVDEVSADMRKFSDNQSLSLTVGSQDYVCSLAVVLSKFTATLNTSIVLYCIMCWRLLVGCVHLCQLEGNTV